MPLGDGHLIGAMVKARFPVAGAILQTLGPEIIAAIRAQPSDRPINEVVNAVAPAIEAIADRNPEIKNNLNLEPPIQSGVTVTSVSGALGLLILNFALYLINGTVSAELMGGTVMAELAFLGTLYRRWKPNLLPMFSGKK